MKKQTHEGYPGSRLYFTEADPSCQELYGISLDVLSCESKLWLILTDHLIVSTGHLLRSEKTFNWLQDNQDSLSQLSNDEALLLSLSDRYSSACEFAEDQVIVGSQQQAGSLSRKEALRRAKVIDDVFCSAITWSSAGQGNKFREMMMRDCRDPKSLLRRKMVGASRKQIDLLTEAIEDSETFTRGVLNSLTRQYCPRFRKLLRRYGDCFYYMSGALHKEAVPVMHADAVSLCRQKVSHTVSQSCDIDTRELWRKLIDSWHVSFQALSSYPLEEVAKVRQTSEGQRLRQRWRDVVVKAKNRVKITPSLRTVEEISEALKILFEEELSRQRRRSKQWRKWRKTLDVVCDVTTCLGTIPLVGCFFSGIGVLAATGRHGLHHAEKHYGNTELVLIGEKVTRSG